MSNYSRETIGAGEDGFPQGLHVCHIFSDDAERADVLARFLQRGLEAGDKALCLVDHKAPSEVFDELADLGLDRTLAEGRLTTSSAADTYCPSGVFAPDALLAGLKAMALASRTEGFTGLRIAGDMAWIHRRGVSHDQVMEYELKVRRYIDGIPCTAVCEYDARRFDGPTLLDILSVHPAVLVRGQVVRNPYYMEPDEFFARRRPTAQP